MAEQRPIEHAERSADDLRPDPHPPDPEPVDRHRSKSCSGPVTPVSDPVLADLRPESPLRSCGLGQEGNRFGHSPNPFENTPLAIASRSNQGGPASALFSATFRIRRANKPIHQSPSVSDA